MMNKVRAAVGALATLTAASALLLGTASSASAVEWGNPNWQGILAGSAPTGFPVSPAAFDLSSGPANFTVGVSVKNLTSSDQTVSLRLAVHHILTYQGQDISDGQPGQAGITFPKGAAKQTTQTMSFKEFETFTVPAGATSFVLNFPATITTCGYYQVDVQTPTGRPSLAVGFTRALGCARLTPGFWKTHQSATTPLLPVNLGGYTVSTFSQASAIFNAMKCNDPANCLAGHLLAAELDVASGASKCAASTIQAANTLLSDIGYAGPMSYTLSSTQASQALSLETALDNYTNDSTNGTC
jgi:hypothetical protein